MCTQTIHAAHIISWSTHYFMQTFFYEMVRLPNTETAHYHVQGFSGNTWICLSWSSFGLWVFSQTSEVFRKSPRQANHRLYQKTSLTKNRRCLCLLWLKTHHLKRWPCCHRTFSQPKQRRETAKQPWRQRRVMRLNDLVIIRWKISRNDATINVVRIAICSLIYQNVPSDFKKKKKQIIFLHTGLNLIHF